MRILEAVGWYFPESLGGTERYVQALGREFRSDGDEVFIAAPKPGAAAIETYDYDGVQVIRYPTPKTPSRDEVRGRSGAASAHFSAIINSVRPDVVHMHTFVTGLGLPEATAAKLAGAMVVVTSHSSALGFTCGRGTLMRDGIEPCDGRVHERDCASCCLQGKGVPKPIARLLGRIPDGMSKAAVAGPLFARHYVKEDIERQRELFDVVDCFVVLGEWAKSILIRNGAPEEKVVVNRLGVQRLPESTFAQQTAHAAGLRALYLGRFDQIKGVLDLAIAVRLIPSGVDVAVDFCGPVTTAVERNVRDEVARLTAGSRSRVLEAVRPESIYELLSKYDVLCCPSACAEGGPTVALEAMAVGVPVIGTTMGSLPELVGDGVFGRLVPPRSPEAFARALVELASSPQTLDQWKSKIPAVRTMSEVASDYRRLFRGYDAHD